MHPSANGILAIWHDIVPDRRDDVLRWYDREHHAERVAVPGFLSARRYRAVCGTPQLFIRYETADVGVLASPAYLERLNDPTPWTRRSQPDFRDNSRTVCRVAQRDGRGEGGVVVTLRLTPEDPARPLDHVDWPALSGRLLQAGGVVAAELWVADRERSGLPSREKLLRGAADQVANVVVLIHATSDQAASAVLADDPLAAFLADAAWARTQAGIYRLSYALDAGNFS